MGDPYYPDTVTVTPPAEILALDPAGREKRVWNLVNQAHDIVDEAIETHLQGRQLTARVVLFSGGADSTVLAHLMRYCGVVTHFAHANTGIGVEATRQFVRDTCAAWGYPLIEKHPETPYRDLVIANGFPGPGHHSKMYQRLKERCLRQVRRELVTNGRHQRVLFIAGRRRAESIRRSGFRSSGKHQVPLHERETSVIWASPMAMWTRYDLLTYRALMNRPGHPDRLHDPVPFNTVSDQLGMSAECLCGSFATPGELERIRAFYPEVAAHIDALTSEVTAAGWEYPHNVWGHGIKGKSHNSAVGRLCSSCELRGTEMEGMI